MLRSKSRSGCRDLGQKNQHHSSVFSRTLSASKLCRGDALGAQVDKGALKSVNKNTSNVSNQYQGQSRAMLMQQQQQQQLQLRQMEDFEGELQRTKEKLQVSEMEKSVILDQLEDVKSRANEELAMKLGNLQRLLLSCEDELKMKDEKIRTLESQVKDEELGDARQREKHLTVLYSENEKRIQELEAQVENTKESTTLIASLRAKIESMERSREVVEDDASSNEEEMRHLKLELQVTKENLARAEEDEKKASSRAKTVLDEMELLKTEWKQAIQAEEKSTKAMEDLAFALKEVATESNHAKEKLNVMKDELEHVREEGEKLKEMVRCTEERYQKLLQEAKQEADLHRNAADRLRVEADETLLAWNGKEMGFVSCIKRAEEEKAMALHESHKLGESLKATENMTRAAREETYRLRDVLKQAVNEANAAKAAAGIARDENSFLKDCLGEKEETLHFLTKENERLRVSEAAAHENVKQLKILLSTVSAEYKDKDQNGILMFGAVEDEEHNGKQMKKNFSFSLEDLKFLNDPDDDNMLLHEDPVKAEALKGSIFDTSAETPKSEPRTPQAIFTHQRKHSYALTDDGGTTPSSEDFEHLETAAAHEESDTEKHTHRKMKTMFLRRVGDLLTIRRGYHKKEASIDSLITTQPSSLEK